MNRVKPNGRERGAILILAMLVLLVLAAVLLQIWFTADVDQEIALNEKINFPIRQAAYGAFMKACSVLVQDLQEGSDPGDETSGGDAGGQDGGEGDEGGGDLGGGGLGGGGGGQDPLGGGSGGGSMTDSMVDSWARCGEISMAFASDVDVQILIRDEDGKFNILSILSKDEEYAKASKDRLIRVIDLFREGTKADVSFGSAREMVEAMEDWMRGNRDREKFPRPMVKTGPGDPDPDEIEEEPLDFPLTLEELAMCEGITKELLYGYREEEVRIPGLMEYITIYSNLAYDAVQADEEETDLEKDPFDGGTGEDGGEYNQTPDDGSDQGEEDTEEEVAAETNNGLINVNTAPLPVLKALVDNKDLSHSVLDQVDEFRQKALEAYEKAMEDYDWNESLFNQDNNSGSEGDGSEEEDKGKDFFDKEDEDFIFTSGKEVFDRVENYFDTHFNIDEDVKTEYGNLLCVKSNVFTIYITVKSMETRISRSYRAVVWRRTGASSSGAGSEDPSQEGGTYSTTGAESAQIITLVPLELFNHPVPYRPEEEELLAEREEAYQYEKDYY